MKSFSRFWTIWIQNLFINAAKYQRGLEEVVWVSNWKGIQCCWKLLIWWTNIQVMRNGLTLLKTFVRNLSKYKWNCFLLINVMQAMNFSISSFKALEGQDIKRYSLVGFGCADGRDRALQSKCPIVGISCSSKGFAPLQPSQAGDKGGFLQPVQS